MAGQRQPQAENRTATFTVRGSGDTTFMRLGELLYKSKSNAQPAFGALVMLSAHLLEHVENTIEELGSNADARILNIKPHVAVILAAKRDRYSASGGRKFQRIVQQVPYNLFYTGRIALYQQWRILLNPFSVQRDLAVACLRLHGFHGRRDNIGEIYQAATQGELAGFDARQVQEVGDDLRL